MGFFGSTTKTYYNSFSSPLFEEVPSLVQQSVRGAVSQNRNIAEDLITNLVNGIGYKANNLYQYAKRGQHPWGLPDGSVSVFGTEIPEKLDRIIEYVLGRPIQRIFNNIEVDPTTNHIIYTVRYYLLSSAGVVLDDTEYTWTYDESTNVYPSLDLELYDVQDTSPYYPIIPIRMDGESTMDGEYSQEVKRACNYLGVNAQDLTDSIMEQGLTAEQIEAGDEPDNPVEDAFVILGVEVTADTQEGMEYLYRFFAHMYGTSASTYEDYLYWEANKEVITVEGETVDTEPPPINTVTLEDANYKMELGWLYITEDIITGSIGKTGTYATEYVAGDLQYFGSEGTDYFSGAGMYFRKQISDTQYSEFFVKGLTHSNWAVGKELHTTLTKAYAASGDDLNHCFTIPLRKDLIKAMGAIKTHEVMYIAIRLVVNDKLVVKLKWYQTSLFRFVMVVIAIVLAVTGNVQAGVALFSSTMVVNVLIQLLITQILLPLVLKKVADLVGEELALVIAIVVTYMTGQYMGVDSTYGAIQAGMQGAQGAMNLYYANEFEGLADELEALNSDIEDLLDEQAEIDKDVAYAVNTSKADTFALMDAEKYVEISKRIIKLPQLITKTTSNYTDIMRYLDTPDSPLRLGNTLT